MMVDQLDEMRGSPTHEISGHHDFVVVGGGGAELAEDFYFCPAPF
jgi:hypothetical protein